LSGTLIGLGQNLSLGSSTLDASDAMGQAVQSVVYVATTTSAASSTDVLTVDMLTSLAVVLALTPSTLR